MYLVLGRQQRAAEREVAYCLNATHAERAGWPENGRVNMEPTAEARVAAAQLINVDLLDAPDGPATSSRQDRAQQRARAAETTGRSAHHSARHGRSRWRGVRDGAAVRPGRLRDEMELVQRLDDLVRLNELRRSNWLRSNASTFVIDSGTFGDLPHTLNWSGAQLEPRSGSESFAIG